MPKGVAELEPRAFQYKGLAELELRALHIVKMVWNQGRFFKAWKVLKK
jgi:hypothetical protein